jgi:O-antigen/teichoic acid export membrane protein
MAKEKTGGAGRSISSNFLYSSLTTVLTIVAPLVTYPYVSRVLGPENMGRLGVASSFSNYFIVAAGLGFATYGVRAVAAARSEGGPGFNKKATELIILAIAADVIATVGYFAAIALVPRYRSDIGLFAIFGLTVIAVPLGIDWFFKGIEEFRYIGLRNTALQPIFIVLLFILVRTRSDAPRYALLFVASSVAGMLLNVYTARRFVRLDFRGIKPAGHLGPMLIYALMSFAITGYTNFDFLFLGLVSSTREAGYYSIGIRLARMSTTVAATLSGVLLPRLSSLVGRDEGEYRRILKNSFSAILLFAIPAAVGLAVTSDDLAFAFGGRAFAASAVSVRICALVVPIVSVTNFLQMQLFIPRQRERQLLLSFVLALAVTGAAMALLVRPLGQEGAAWGMVLGEGSVLAALVLFAGRTELRDIFGLSRLWKYFAGAAACGAAAFAPRLILAGGFVRLGLSIAAGILAYAIALLALRDATALLIVGKILGRFSAPRERAGDGR